MDVATVLSKLAACLLQLAAIRTIITTTGLSKALKVSRYIHTGDGKLYV